MLGAITVNVCKILFVLALFYPIYKMLDKRKGLAASSSLSTTRRIFYQLHVNGSKMAVIFGFIHGLIITPLDQIYVFTGWLLGIVMVALLLLGAFLSIKNNSKPMNREDDVKWRKMRMTKWILTILVFLVLVLHYLLSDWLL